MPRTEADTPNRARPTRAGALPAEERRTMIIAATLDLLIEHGEMVTTRQIADAAGIAEGTIFRVFPDKDALVIAAIDVALDPAPLELALRGIDVTLPYEERLAAAVRLIQQRVVDVWRLVSGIGARFHDHLQRPMGDSDALVALVADRAHSFRVGAPVAARLLRALTLSTTHPMLAGQPMEAPEIVQLFLHGVCSEGELSC